MTGSDAASPSEEIAPARRRKPINQERLLWMALCAGLSVLFVFSAVFQLEGLSEAEKEVYEEGVQLENLKRDLAEYRQISEGLENFRTQLEACSIAVSVANGEVEELAGELSTISLDTQSMYHNGWRGIDREKLIASSENFGVLAESKSFEEGDLTCGS
jgi:hypothetical protein